MNAVISDGYFTHLLFLMCVIPIVLSEIYEELPNYRAEEKDCPGEFDRAIENVQRPWGEPDRAFHTLPEELVIRNSSIPKAGLGVFATTFIPRYTWLGEYEGEVVDASHISAYAWVAHRDGEADYYLDGADLATSSWQRFVNNPPRHNSEENVVMHECRGKVYYMAYADIYPGEELFVYYGDKYAAYLGIDVRKYHSDLPPAALYGFDVVGGNSGLY